MAKILYTGSGGIWTSTSSPGVSETLITIGNLWLNTSTNNIFICKDPTVGAQVWDEYPTATVSVSKGGTGAITLTGILTGNGTSAITGNAVTQHGVIVGGASNAASSLSVASTGTVLTGVTGADPAFSATPSVTSVAIGSGGLTITSGTGAPAASVPKGSLYLRTDGSGATDRLYIATDAVGTWTSVVTVA